MLTYMITEYIFHTPPRFHALLNTIPQRSFVIFSYDCHHSYISL